MSLSSPLTPPIAAVLCGGGARGALEVGFYRALVDLGIRIDYLVGSSVGALNGAAIAAGLSPEALVEIWEHIDRKDIASPNWRGWLRPWRCSGAYTLEPLRRLVQRVLPVSRFERLVTPLTIVTTDLTTGRPAYWERSGDLIEPLIASMSLPGVFPPVELAGRPHVDGAITNNLPVDRACALGAQSTVSILCTCCPAPRMPPRHALGVLKRSFLVSLDYLSNDNLERYRSRGMRVHIVQPRFAVDVGLLDFRYTWDLIEVGYEQTLEYFGRTDRAGTACLTEALEGAATVSRCE